MPDQTSDAASQNAAAASHEAAPEWWGFDPEKPVTITVTGPTARLLRTMAACSNEVTAEDLALVSLTQDIDTCYNDYQVMLALVATTQTYLRTGHVPVGSDNNA